MTPKRIALWFLIASVGASALLGIVIVLAGTLGEIEARIILTTLTISAMSICALAAGALWESGRKRSLSLSGMILAGCAAILFLIGIWARISGEEFWKFSASAGIIAVATAHACLVSLASLAKAFAWARTVAYVAIYTLAAELIILIYWQPDQPETIVRIIGATSIVVAAITILTPVFHRLSRKEVVADQPHAQARILIAEITCPQCGARLPNADHEIACGNCGCRFTITILQTGSIGDTATAQ